MYYTYEITTFENLDFGSHDPTRSHDLIHINYPLTSETVRIRVKLSKFSNPLGLIPTKLQLLKISILGHMTP